MTRKCVFVSALFDIGRADVDSRSIEDYLGWIRKTSNLIPELIIYHDGILDPFENEFLHLRKIDRNSLHFFNVEDDLKNLLTNFVPDASNDITFRLPAYSLVQFSKFELLQKAVSEFGAESAFWVDAGISRFVDKFSIQNSDLHVQRFISQNYFSVFEIDLKRNFSAFKFKIRNPKVGSCRRVISGTSFWLEANMVNVFLSQMKQITNKWLIEQIWDNEQMALRKIFLESKLQTNTYFISQGKQQTGSVFRFFGGQSKQNILLSKLIGRGLT